MCMFLDRLYILDDFPIPSGVAYDSREVVDEWHYERMIQFHNRHEQVIKGD